MVTGAACTSKGFSSWGGKKVSWKEGISLCSENKGTQSEGNWSSPSCTGVFAMSAKPGFRLGKLLCLEERGGFLPVCRISISALPSAISSPFCLGNGDERSFGPVQKMDVLVRAVRQFCDSSTEMSFRSSVPPSSMLETCAGQTGPAWYRKNHQKTPVDFSRVMFSLSSFCIFAGLSV